MTDFFGPSAATSHLQGMSGPGPVEAGSNHNGILDSDAIRDRGATHLHDSG